MMRGHYYSDCTLHNLHDAHRIVAERLLHLSKAFQLCFHSLINYDATQLLWKSAKMKMRRLITTHIHSEYDCQLLTLYLDGETDARTGVTVSYTFTPEKINIARCVVLDKIPI